MIEEFVMLVMKAIPKGKYEKFDNEYRFEPHVGNYIIVLTDSNIEFKIKTLKWIPGSYEPIEGSELFKSISYDELKVLTEEKRLSIMADIVSRLKNID